jgi:hypothetical protein
MGGGEIFGVRFQDRSLAGFDLIRHGHQDGVFLGRAELHQFMRGGTGSAAHVEDGGLDVCVGHVDDTSCRPMTALQTESRHWDGFHFGL